jgi:hypothetical protein
VRTAHALLLPYPPYLWRVVRRTTFVWHSTWFHGASLATAAMLEILAAVVLARL